VVNKTMECAASVQGLICWHSTVVTTPIPLCRKHLAAVMHQATQIFVSSNTVLDRQELGDEDLIARARVLSIPNALAGPHEEAVYFLRNGDRVKIGYSSNLRLRITALSLRPRDAMLLLAGDKMLERALHRHFHRQRVFLTEWFDLAGSLQRFLDNQQDREDSHREPPTPPPARKPHPLLPVMGNLAYPDGTSVRRDEWPELYSVFLDLCKQQQYATKADLKEQGPYDSRDTVRRAVDVWLTRGVQVRKQGRVEQFYLPTDSDD
jgi:hypothetical protein